MIVHPGEIILDSIDAHGWSQYEFAQRCGMTAKTVSKLVNGLARVQPHMAVKFEQVLKRPAHYWLNLQAQYDLAQLKK